MWEEAVKLGRLGKFDIRTMAGDGKEGHWGTVSYTNVRPKRASSPLLVAKRHLYLMSWCIQAAALPESDATM